VNVLQFNWPWYAAAVAGLLFAIANLWLLALPGVLAVALLAFAGCGAFWAIGSLLASHWVYDRSPLYRWDWVRGQLGAAPALAVTIHAGFDEASEHLQRLWGDTHWTAWDIFDPSSMTENSIIRARKVDRRTSSSVAVNASRLPAAESTFDVAFLIFAAHELRSAAAREQLFEELFRVLKPGGVLLLVEHLRDWKNFVAYGPGFLHFLPRREWLRLKEVAGFRKSGGFSITPFVRVFRMSKPHDK
jgi:SAM-dependent methyltransferase